jgi:hypothetical protein
MTKKPGENSVHYLRIDEDPKITTLCSRDLKKRGLKVTIAVDRVSCAMCLRHLETDAKPCDECALLHPPPGRRRSTASRRPAYVAKVHWFKSCGPENARLTRDRAEITCRNCLRGLGASDHLEGLLAGSVRPRKLQGPPPKLHLQINREWLACGKPVAILRRSLPTGDGKSVTCGMCRRYVERGYKKAGSYLDSRAKVHYLPAGKDFPVCHRTQEGLRFTSDRELVTCAMCRNFLVFGKLLPFVPSPWRQVR